MWCVLIWCFRAPTYSGCLGDVQDCGSRLPPAASGYVRLLPPFSSPVLTCLHTQQRCRTDYTPAVLSKLEAFYYGEVTSIIIKREIESFLCFAPSNPSWSLDASRESYPSDHFRPAFLGD